MKNKCKCALLSIVALTLTACGLKGPLTLPPVEEPQSTTPKATSKPVSPSQQADVNDPADKKGLQHKI